ncbi:fido (protein-threonine AMPylation protein) [Mycobacterium frederiksbergense]|uniref:protein adenylyltransferase n=1 Tax=Mycolicibacterium frederiksbergense TaxID=117567 RepID=A0ABT6L3Z9_9MYCO|nr:Fic family protein [Mycolicibacterium frederiksbergense]MDH6197035.1 fido (protein-threonine AMPylation protein) [Mycolicibacterium frederiksbergense]
MLRNNFGVHDAATLAQLDFMATAGRILQVHLRSQDAELDVHSLHQHVFGDVYAWAGKPRIVELRRGDSSFGSSARIPRALDPLHVEIGRLADEGTTIDDGTLSYRLARIYADYNQIHPFREGNGRTGTLLLHLLAGRAGRRLLLDDMSRSEWIGASRDSMPFRRDGTAALLRPVRVRRVLVFPARPGGQRAGLQLGAPGIAHVHRLRQDLIGLAADDDDRVVVFDAVELERGVHGVRRGLAA